MVERNKKIITSNSEVNNWRGFVGTYIYALFSANDPNIRKVCWG